MTWGESVRVVLRARGLSRFYPGVRALDGVDFDLLAGEVHVLFGENGAGKSTLISLLAGAGVPSDGQIEVQGLPVTFRNVHDARKHGISAVFQEFSLIPTLTVAQNLCLGEEPVRHGVLDRARLLKKAQDSLDALGFEVDASQRVATLSRAQQQMVEIAKGLRGPVAVLILDEPTASLTERETDSLFAVISRLKSQGVGIIYISHRMQEIDRIADRVTVLRDGRKVTTVQAADVSHDRLIGLMTGRDIVQIYPRIASTPGEVVLELDRISTRSGVDQASISVRRGEVLGLAGLVGCGKSELLRAAYGLETVTGGRIRLKGQDHTRASPAQSLAAGFFYLPPDRKNEGLVLGFSSADNITLSGLSGLIPPGAGSRKTRSRALAAQAADRVELIPRNLHKAVGLLSGGNQQKALFAKGLTRTMDLYVFDEPTVGVDVGTRAALYRVIQQLCEGGAAVVLISSDLPEILHLSHRVYALCRGRVQGELLGEAITEKNLLNLFFGAEEIPS